jgi:DNA polymerase III alpha subunit
MENRTQARLRSTQLTDRTVWFDGDSSFDPTKLMTLLNKYDIRFVDETNTAVDEYNRHASKAKALVVKEQCSPIATDWTMPDEYKTLDIVEYLANKHDLLTKGKTQQEQLAREERLAQELVKYTQSKLTNVLRAIIWIINTLSANNTVWGVGRGSSVSSYVLYVIGVHDVDSFAYGLDIDDFLHE